MTATEDNRAYFVVQVGAMACSLYPFYRLPFQRRRTGEKTPPVLAAVGSLLRRPEVVTFFLVMFLMGILMGQITAFLFVYLADELDAPPSLFGVCLAVMCVTEVPFFFFSGHLIKRLGNDVVLHLGLLTYILRFVYYSYLEDAWLVLPAEALHGLTYAASWAASTDYAASIAPPGLEASMQGFLSGIHWYRDGAPWHDTKKLSLSLQGSGHRRRRPHRRLCVPGRGRAGVVPDICMCGRRNPSRAPVLPVAQAPCRRPSGRGSSCLVCDPRLVHAGDCRLGGRAGRHRRHRGRPSKRKSRRALTRPQGERQEHTRQQSVPPSVPGRGSLCPRRRRRRSLKIFEQFSLRIYCTSVVYQWKSSASSL